MSFKLKISMGLLAIAAVFSVVAFGHYFNKQSALVLGVTQKQATPLATPDSDADHDGLSNDQEAYWNTDFHNPDSDGDGFKDGEEVATGHDPRVKGPNDFLSKTTGHQKRDLSSLIVSGIFAGDLKPDSQNFDKSVNQITDQLFTDSLTQIIPDGSPKFITVEDSETAIAKYETDMFPPIRNLSGEVGSFADIMNLISNKAPKSEIQTEIDATISRNAEIIKTLQQIEVPKSEVSTHASLISSLKEAINAYPLLIPKNEQGLIPAFTAIMTLTQVYYGNIQQITKHFIEKSNER